MTSLLPHTVRVSKSAVHFLSCKNCLQGTKPLIYCPCAGLVFKRIALVQFLLGKRVLICRILDRWRLVKVRQEFVQVEKLAAPESVLVQRYFNINQTITEQDARRLFNQGRTKY